MTYNIGYASGAKNNLGSVLVEEEVRNNLGEMILALQEQDADVIALQEVDFFASRSFNIDQLEYLAHGLNMPYAAYAITWNKRYIAWPYWPPKRHFGRVVSGQAVLSRYPIIDQQIVRFEKPHENPFWYNWFYVDRVGQRLTLDIGDEVLIFWNVHLEAYHQEARLKQIQTLSQYLNGDSHPAVVVAGDFNSVSQIRPNLSPQEREALEDRGEGMATLILTTGLVQAEDDRPNLSFPSWNPIKKIDHILSKGLTLTTAGNITNLTASDHLPVWAEFEWD